MEQQLPKKLGKQLRVMTVLGTRPEIIRLSRVIWKLDQYTEHTIIHTGQNYDFELSEIFFRSLGIRNPNKILNCAGKSSVETVAKVITQVDEAIGEFNPDAFLILGDTNSALSAYSAKRKRIPIFHMEAGNRCRDQRVPEEINRKIVDSLSDINMPYSEISRQNLLSEGFPADQIIKTGSPMKEVIASQSKAVASSTILNDLGLKPLEYFVASIHREENVDCSENLEKLIAILNGVAKQKNKPIIFSCHPRTRKRISAANLALDSKISLSKPMDFHSYLKLQQCALAVMSDSGTITEEASLLNFPAVNLRESHERLEGMDEGVVIMSGLNGERVMQALTVALDQSRGDRRSLKIPNDYDVDNVSEKVLRVILSYSDFIQSRVWRRK